MNTGPDFRTDAQIQTNAYRRLDGGETGLIGYWRLDGTEDLGVGAPGENDLRDYSWTGAHAGMDEPPIFVEGRPLERGMAFYRDRGSVVEISLLPEYDIPSGLTVEAWVKASDAGNGVRSRFFSSSGGGIGFGRNENGSVFFTTFGVRDYFFSGQPFEVGKWVHIAVVFDSSFDASLYVDGVFAQKITHNAPAIPWQSSAFIGRQGGGFGWQGSIAEVRYWNVERTPSQIAAAMHRPLTGTEAGLVGYWPLDSFEDLGVGEPGSNDLRDVSVFANHGHATAVFEGFNDQYFLTAEFGFGAGEAGFLVDQPSGFGAALGREILTVPSEGIFYMPTVDECTLDIGGPDAAGGVSGIPDGEVNFFDVLYFLQEFDNGNMRADIAPESSADGVLDELDIEYFLRLIEAGCP